MATENVKLGVCTVTFDGVDLGYTKGGVEVSVAVTTHDVMVRQFGAVDQDQVVQARSVRAVVPLAETTLANLVRIMPGAVLDSNGSKRRVDVPMGVGISLLNHARELVLHPVAAPDQNDDLVIFKAAPRGEFRQVYKKDEERVWAVEFVGFYDPVTERLFAIGDKAA